MKFGKRMRCLIAPEWEGGYVDYKGLKKTIKLLTDGSDTQRIGEFRQILLRELAKVNASFFCILNDLTNCQDIAVEMNGNYEHLNFALLQALELSNRIDALRRYVVLNYLAVVKICKKFAKTLSDESETINSDLQLQPFYAGNYVDQLYSHTAKTTDRIIRALLPNMDNKPVEECCPICLYHFKSPVTLSCHHTFCWSCLAKAAEHHINACPMCRQVQSIDPRDYEIDGLLQQFLKRYSHILEYEAPDQVKQILEHAIEIATRHMDTMQSQLATAPPSCPVVPESAPEEVGKKVIMPRVSSIAYHNSWREYSFDMIKYFEDALASGCHILGLDVQLSKDGQVVVHHDSVDPCGRFICNMSTEELAEMGIYSLQHILDIVQVPLYICITSEAVIVPLMSLLMQICSQEDCFWSAPLFYLASGNHYQLIAVNGYRNSIPILHGLHTVAITSSIPLGYCKSFEQLHITHVCVEAQVVTRGFVIDAHSRGMYVFVCNVNHENVAWKMLEDIGGVDGILSSYPAMLSQTLLLHALEEDRRGPPQLLDNTETKEDAVVIYSPGDPVEINSLNDTSKWYSGVILAVNTLDEDNTYSVLWWLSDNSQRRASNVLPHQLRKPVPKFCESYFGYGIDVAFGAIKTALGWATAPFVSSA
ncbi:hypothetical protein THRCLA_04393 [Thraustotheca clavata]|uniref:RING-type domain-containing protein n=1 Tax=Thraustotheca clavata TaxID=74557 RepID=A0A1V9ZZ51_9STRA|nr:hypothetical protein THRCLA_04393 [Thraustotheca clavata]